VLGKGVRELIIVLAVVFIFSQSAMAEDLTPALCKEKAIAAGKVLEQEGQAGIARIMDEAGEFRFADGNGYVWVHNLEGIMVMHPVKPELNEKSLSDMRDVNGIYVFVAMNEIVEEYGQGWVPYSWPKPEEETISPKVSYVVLAQHYDGEFVVGAGMYDVTADELRTQFPEDPVYEE